MKQAGSRGCLLKHGGAPLSCHCHCRGTTCWMTDASERVVVDVTLVGFRVVEVPAVLPDKEC